MIVPAAAGDGPAIATDAPMASGVVNVETSIADIGKRKPTFGQHAHRMMTDGAKRVEDLNR